VGSRRDRTNVWDYARGRLNELGLYPTVKPVGFPQGGDQDG
jgi:hypothetical protein